MKPPTRVIQSELIARQLVAGVTLPGGRPPGVAISGDVGHWQLVVFEKESGDALERCRACALIDLIVDLARCVEGMRRGGLWWPA